jgi:hypothetical protein
MRPFGRVLAMTVALLGALGGFAGGAAATTFEGTCALTGTFRFDPPLGLQPRQTALTDRAAGACTGTIDGIHRVDAPVRLKARGSGTLSCLGGQASTRGVLIFTQGTKRKRDDAKLVFSTRSEAAALQGIAVFRGAVSGHGVAHVTFLPYADEAAMEACLAAQLEAARYDVFPRTLTPVVG